MQRLDEYGKEDVLRARLAAVVESSDDAIISKTLEGIITTWNGGAQRIFGYTAEEVIGKSITIIIPPELQHEEPVILEKLGRGERIDHYETIRMTKTGERLVISLTVSPVRDSTGKIVGVSKVARDITVRKRALEALQEETRMLDLLNKTGRIIAAQLDLPQLVQSITDAATELTTAKFGAFFYSPNQSTAGSFELLALSGTPRNVFEKSFPSSDIPLFNATFSGKSVVRFEDITKDKRYGAMPQDGMPFRSYLAVPVTSRSGQVLGGLFFGHPDAGIFSERHERLMLGVTAQAAVAIDNARLYENATRSAEERKQLLDAERAARAEAERVSLLKDEFLANLSHELRTPLNAILGWSQLLRSESITDTDLLEGLTVIERSARVQTQLISDLLDMSRIVAGKMNFEVQRVDLQEVVKGAVLSVRQSADAKGIRLQVVIDPSAGPVRGDPNRLQQCLWNLLSNAIKFTPKGGAVQVSISKVNSHVEVCVSDNGPGISPDFLPHLFERFRQADASTTRRHGGLGLGLAIVKSLVELHGGTVRAASEGEGKGAAFYIDLPIMAADPLRSVAMESLSNEPGHDLHTPDRSLLAGLTVLAVDDEPDSRNLIKRMLEDCGARVLPAASAKEAFALLRERRPDILISDIGMPEEDGYQLMRRIRKLPAEEGGLTPAAALTAFARTEDRTKALRAGYQIHVAKPVDPVELTEVVASLASRGSGTRG